VFALAAAGLGSSRPKDGIEGSGAPLPVTEAARDADRRLAQDGWETHDITALVEYGRRSARFAPTRLSGRTRSGSDVSPYRSVRGGSTGNGVRVSASGGGDAFEGIADGVEVDTVEVIE
jgi:hypothetical protein